MLKQLIKPENYKTPQVFKVYVCSGLSTIILIIVKNKDAVKQLELLCLVCMSLLTRSLS